MPSALLAAVLVSGCVEASNHSSEVDAGSETGEGAAPTPDELPVAERAYIDAALSVLRDNYHRPDRVNWSQMERVAYDRLATLPTRGGSYIAISAVLSHIGDIHNAFDPPASTSEPPTLTGKLPEVTRSGDRLLTIALPPVSPLHDTHDAYAAHAHTAIAGLYHDRVCGWIIDLRGNTGGSMYPMLAAVAPLLADQQVMSTVEPDGSVHSDIAFDATGHMLIDGSPAVEAHRWRGEEGDDTIADALTAVAEVPPVGRDEPVAVLTDGRTASAAEAVVVAFEGRSHTRRFGSATSGVPTGRRSFELDDGAVLKVAATRMTDRTGVAHDSALQPDVESPDPADRAAAWLLDTEACRSS